MGETVLWLIRHPEPDSSARGLCYGSMDVPLSDDGVRHSKAIAEMMAIENFDAVYTSPKRRCVEMARTIARGRAVATLEDFCELDFGLLEGRSYDEIAALYPDIYRQWMENPTATQFPQGENFCQMSSRVRSALEAMLLRHAQESVLVVTHGGPIRVILAEALGIPPQNIFRIEQSYGAINRIRYRDGTPSVELVNAATV